MANTLMLTWHAVPAAMVLVTASVAAQTGTIRDPAPPQSGTASVAGRVIAADTSQPLRRASVRISSAGLSPLRPVTTDSEGMYVFEDLPAGRFTLTVRKEGYLDLSYGQTRPLDAPRELELSRGQSIANVDFALNRAGAIIGRILDEYGEPLIQAEVRAVRQMHVPGSRVLAAGATASTNDLGEFRLFGLLPGRYFLSASWHGAGATLSRDEARHGLAPTYYPGSLQLADASAVVVDVGQVIGPMTFSLLPARLATIAGQLIDADGRAIADASVAIAPRIAGMMSGPTATVRTAPDGTFLIGEVAPGDYDLRARFPRSGAIAIARFRTNGEDVSGILLSPSPPVTIAGRVVLDGAEGSVPALRPSDVLIRLVSDPPSTQAMPSATIGTVDEAFRFQLQPQPGLVIVRTAIKSPDWFLKAVRLNGVDVTDSGFEALPGQTVAGVEVELTARPSEVSGNVNRSDAQPCSECVVMLYPHDPGLWNVHTRYLAVERADRSGAFRAHVPAGRYFVVALMSYDLSTIADPEFVEAVRPLSVDIVLSEGERKTLNLRASQLP